MLKIVSVKENKISVSRFMKYPALIAREVVCRIALLP